MSRPVTWPLPLLLLTLAATCGATPPLPSPGNYRIDGEAHMRSGSGPTLAERIERWDGSNGNRVVTTVAGGRSQQQTYAGTEPVTWCVLGVSVPANQLPDRCKTRWWPAQGGSELQAECQAGRLQEHWKQIDAKTWERQMTFTPGPGGGNDPAAALAMVEKGLSPAEAAKARAAIAALPSAQQRAAAMAPVYEKIEATIRNGTPEQAAEARQQLAALQAAQGGGGGVVWTTTLTERWTRIAEACAPPRKP
ncbi:hypothetical protein J2X20_000954 [Pelomonas saccharophila]|uniref:Lipoprotein n=1 Tax=Roseateles saccharophilus TaxID=304 RepID=A0ABU1YJB3_ROSSA|nr:hypothetical protein [Roseateles saccharophilus]MDR7268325.1 hypothetical protein [Roseateles saccharophilus]